jgi:hypothetical protein
MYGRSFFSLVFYRLRFDYDFSAKIDQQWTRAMIFHWLQFDGFKDCTRCYDINHGAENIKT